MKAKQIGGLLLALTAFAGCDDTTGTLGLDLLPESDGFWANTATFSVMTESLAVDSVYAKSSIGYVGKFTDPVFGTYEASFLTELYCLDDFALPEVYQETAFDEDGTATEATGLLYKDSVVAVNLVLFYEEWFGDSLNACRMSVYELNKELEHNRYTNINPEEYYDPNDANALLGRKAYSAYDTSIPDSIRNGTDSYGYALYSPYVSFPLDPVTFGEDRILNVYRNDPSGFKEAFTNDFRGVYVESDYGDGTILYIERVDIQMTLCCHYTDDDTGVKLLKEDGTDSLYNSTQTIFASTKEIMQINRFENSQKVKERASETNWTYIKSPAGIFTQATLPYDEIYEQLSNDTLNAVQLTFTNYRQESVYEMSMDVPENVLLLRKQDMYSFFENNEVTDDITSFTVSHNNSDTNEYTFYNIARLINTCINEKNQAKEEAGSAWDEEQWMEDNPDWNKVVLIPVVVTYDESSTGQMIEVAHDLQPGYAKLRGGPDTNANGELENPLTLTVTYTTFADTEN